MWPLLHLHFEPFVVVEEVSLVVSEMVQGLGGMVSVEELVEVPEFGSLENFGVRLALFDFVLSLCLFFAFFIEDSLHRQLQN